ncbi:hypothetical protein BAUCODRAFT_450430 [Baudoinia panamericana UAMH 10762]|uniref:Brix domain-containing protein n=1 Tax=Baudoinia panamericana (strain UAMH 10762) TaxID=717646 RepID=M2NEJ2_BAUPA|nr:uncharacterized protein BAUCODRAFT_450430 [Baudoinia panamericana UAMH 10762]EMC97385.1 hypothetical protein BAUCODRAFT_450430 [Baudoinia panamericana UAMH 10762]
MAAVYRSLSKSKANGQTQEHNGDDRPRNRQRVLMLTSRGVTHRNRHLLADLYSLLPHSRKDAKLDSKKNLAELNELADLHNCNNILFFEARKAKDLYLWLSKPPNGPTVKFHCQNVHTMEELNFTGNCLKGSRPILSFDASFDKQAHLRVVKELLTHTFGVPQASRKVKPFVDHVTGFTIAGNKIWIRNYQIAETEQAKGKKPGDQENQEPPAAVSAPKEGKGDTTVSLVEIGPRFVLTPIVVLEGSFGGPVIYENREFVSPNQVRADLRRTKAGRYNKRAEGTLERKVKRRDLGLRTGEGRREIDELDERVLFA